MGIRDLPSRRHAVSAIALLVVACGTVRATRDPAVDFLVSSAADDFHAHPPRPARFRSVRSGYVAQRDGTRQYRLCGEFLPAREDNNSEWTRFVTIKTSGYEQYLGGQAANFCNSSMTWDKGDLSSELQTRLESLK